MSRAFRIVAALSAGITLIALFGIHLSLHRQEQALSAAFFDRAREVLAPQESATVPRLAYEQALARRAPVLGIEGTDPDALDAAADGLFAAQERLAKLQESDTDSALVRDALYPTDFLHTVAAAERARQSFLASGSASAATAYADALSEALETGEHDARALSAAFVRYTADDADSAIVLYSGTLPVKELPHYAAEVADRMEAERGELERRSRCLEGELGLCEIPSLGSLIPLQSTTTQTHPFTEEILELYRESLAPLAIKKMERVTIHDSVCAANLPPPYDFLLVDQTDVPNAPFSFYLDDIYFSKTANADADDYLGHLRERYGASLSPISTSMFYMCPESQRDFGAMTAVLRVGAIAERFPNTAASEREALLSQASPDDLHARAYVLSALQELAKRRALAPLTNEERVQFDALLATAVMLRDRYAGFDGFINRMVRTLEENLLVHERGEVPFDMSARNYFLTFSAFPSLYLAQNISTGAPLTLKRTPQDMNDYTDWAADYLSLRDTVPRSEIARSLRAFTLFHAQ